MSEATGHNWLVRGLIHLTDALLWMTRQLADSAVRRSVYEDLNLPPPPDDAPFPDTGSNFDKISSTYTQSQSVEAEEMKAVLEEMRSIRNAVLDFVHLHPDPGVTGEEILDGLVRLLSMNYVRLRAPAFYWLAQPLLLLDDTVSSGVLPDAITRDAHTVGRNFMAFLENPPKYVGSFPWPPCNTEQDAQLYSDVIFLPVVVGLGALGKWLLSEKFFRENDIQVLYGWEPDPESQTPVADQISGRMLSFSFGSSTPTSTDHIQGSVLATTAIVPRDHGGPGLLLSLGGSAAVATVINQWKLKSTITSASAFSVLFKDDVSFSGPADAGYEFSLEHVPDPTGLPQTIDIGPARLEFGDFKITIGFSSAGFAFRAVAEKSAFVVDSSSHAVLERGTGGKTEKLRVQIGIGVGYAAGHFFIDGGSGFLVTLPVAVVLGPLQFRGITVGLTPSSAPDQPHLDLELSATIVLKIGPVLLTMDRIGLGLTLSDKEAWDVGPRGPKGIGIAVKSEGISGGGYLFFDHTSSTYAGVFDLSITDLFTVKAVGLLTTRINGQKVFSLLIIASVTGLHICLPFGFVLTGLGGLMGIDRDVNLTALEAGVKAHSLDSLMFPNDPIANAPAIVNAAAAAFPPVQGQYLVGAMVQISWGAAQLIRIEVAVIVTLPGFSKWVLLGKVRAFCPTEDNPVLKVIVDLVGDYDGAAKRAFAYLTLNGTKLAELTLSGEAAMLWTWGDNGTFLISFGGFNERYLPLVPPIFPTLARLKLSLKSSENMRIEATVYFAHTSHSTQFGGSLFVVLKAGKFGVEGSLSVNALFQDVEPTFIFELKAKLELKAWDVTLFLVALEGSFAGWHPRHVQGKASFEIFIFSCTFSVDKCWGDTRQGLSIQAVDVSAQFMAALADPRSWNAELPATIQSLVTLRPAGAQLQLHPLGSVSVLQRVVPLGIAIERFGNAPVQGQNLFQIDPVVRVGGSTVTMEFRQEQFARSQFLNMTDDQKLSTPAFERMDAGVGMSTPELGAGPAVTATTQYRTLIYNATTKQAEPAAPYTPNLGLLLAWAGMSASARSTDFKGGSIRYKGPVQPVRVAQLTFVIASTADMKPASAGGLTNGVAPNFTVAAAALRIHLSQNPEQRHDLQILPLTG